MQVSVAAQHAEPQTWAFGQQTGPPPVPPAVRHVVVASGQHSWTLAGGGLGLLPVHAVVAPRQRHSTPGMQLALVPPQQRVGVH